MSSPNHPTSNIEDVFSLTFLTYPGFPGLVMQAYYAKESPIPPQLFVPPSSMLSPMFNPQELFLPEELFPLKKRGCDRSSSYTSTLPQAFEIGESSQDKIKGLRNGRVIIQQDFDNLEAELREIANLEQIIEDIQVRHQADKESLLDAIYEHKNNQEGPSDY
ncbi:hypothetical protein Tco_0457872 [Tanacetum coccineum]